MLHLRALLPLALLSLAVVAHADITSLTDTFEEETASLNHDPFTNWTVTDGTVDVLDSFFGPGNVVDLDGSSSQSGLFTTTEAFAPGTYTLKFDLAGSQRGDVNDVVVTLGTYTTTLTRQGADPFSTEMAVVTLLTPAHLSFYNPGDDNVGALLDNVSVQAVPEPSAVAALGLGGIALLRRRNRR